MYTTDKSSWMCVVSLVSVVGNADISYSNSLRPNDTPGWKMRTCSIKVRVCFHLIWKFFNSFMSVTSEISVCVTSTAVSIPALSLFSQVLF